MLRVNEISILYCMEDNNVTGNTVKDYSRNQGSSTYKFASDEI